MMVDFNEFKKADFSVWKEKAKQDLKGKDFDEALRWQTDHNISLAPYYDSSDQESYSYITDFFRKLNVQPWKLYETVLVGDVRKSREKALNALSNGCDGVIFRSDTPISTVEMRALLEGVYIDICDISFSGNVAFKNYEAFLTVLEEDKTNTQGGLVFSNSPITPPHRGIGLYSDKVDLIENTAEVIGTFIDYLEKAPENYKHLFFKLRVGKSFYSEIARIRALRFLASTLLKKAGIEATDDAIFIHGIPNLSSDYKSTMLSNSSSGLASVIAGVNSIEFELGGDKPASFSKRIGRNTGNLLREESKLVFEKDPIAGNFFLDYLTHTFSQKAWENLKK